MQYPTISEYVKASQDAGDNLDMSTEATDEELNDDDSAVSVPSVAV